MSGEQWLSVEDIAEQLGTHEQTVRRWLRDGRLIGRNFGGRMGYRVRQSDFDTFMEREREQEQVRSQYQEQFHEIGRVMKEAVNIVVENMRAPHEVLYAELQLRLASLERQQQIAHAAEIDLPTLQRVLQESFLTASAELTEQMLATSPAISGLIPLVPLEPLRRRAETIRHLAQARSRILGMLASESPELPRNVRIVAPQP